jgi:hypothetical protein
MDSIRRFLSAMWRGTGTVALLEHKILHPTISSYCVTSKVASKRILDRQAYKHKQLISAPVELVTI